MTQRGLFARLFGSRPLPDIHASGSGETIARATVRNALERPLTLIFEPWATEYEMAPGAVYVCEARSPREGWLEVEYGVEDVTVYAWDACVASIWDRKSGALVDSLDIRVPDFIALDEQSRREDRDAAV